VKISQFRSGRTALLILGLGSAAIGCGGSAEVEDSTGPETAGDDTLLPATAEDAPPDGVWTMAVQYGAVGEPVTPTVPLQVAFLPDGTAYRWVCAGAPADGSLTEACPVVARMECMEGSVAWDGTQWKFEFPALMESFTVEEMGDITPDGTGRILLSYINPTYSGGLFKQIASADDGFEGCNP
jgi:hypothetical protein